MHELRKDVPRDLGVVCGKALEKRPDDRYQTVAELAVELRRFLADEPIQTRPPGWRRRIKRSALHWAPPRISHATSTTLVKPREPLLEQLNATLTRRWDIAPGLSIFRVETDEEQFEFEAGQYCALGLPPSYARVPEADEDEITGEQRPDRLIKRAYSIASSSRQREYLEFYITLVGSGQLTPRLFALSPGDRLWVGKKVTGHFTLEGVPREADLFLLSTGTGLAPYMSMLANELATPDRRRRTVIAHGARHSWDLGYRAELEVLARKHRHLSYIPSITRPTEEETWNGQTGHIQDQLDDGRLEKLSGVPLDPRRAHVFLCGNPAMIETVTDRLRERGFREWSMRENPDGTIHTEKYW
jgi:ferredoxin--NADP+ reductase